MMTTVQSYMRLWKQTLHRWLVDPKVHICMRAAGCTLAGFLLSAASLSHQLQPLALGLICTLTGFQSALAALGSSVGYLLWWGSPGLLGLMWSVLGLVCSLALGNTKSNTRMPMLMPVLSGLVTALAGLWFQHLGGSASPAMYFLRIGLAVGSARLFSIVLSRRDSIADWLVGGVAVLALSQVAPLSWLSLGYPVAAALTVASAFPGAAVAGLALDLADVTPVPMTAVLSLAWLIRLMPGQRSWSKALAPGVAFPVVMVLTGSFHLQPLPGLVVGGLLGLMIPGVSGFTHRRGEVGVAQVRLELVSSVFSQMQQQLLCLDLPPIDEKALVLRACERACGNCSQRKNCTARSSAEALSPQILNFPILDSSLHFSCRRTGRLLQELRRSQEQLRLLRSSRRQQEECRLAVTQQYRFLAEYLQDLSDDLNKRTKQSDQRFIPEVVFSANRARSDNGDRCLSFNGTGCRHYVAILDGMGTGIGAMDEAITAGRLLKQLLSAGFPAQFSLSTLNSLCALRGRAGAVTVDLVELQLDTGKAAVYKWGAPPSWLLRGSVCEKIGTAGPPPGLLVADSPEAAQRLSLRRGEMLVLLSDGVGGEDALRCNVAAEEPLGELAVRILECGSGEGNDDATVAIVRLRPRDLST